MALSQAVWRMALLGIYPLAGAWLDPSQTP